MLLLVTSQIELQIIQKEQIEVNLKNFFIQSNTVDKS